MIEDGSLRLNWKFTWIKYSPVDSTKTNWEILDYWAGFHQLHSINEIWRELLSGTGVFALQDNAADMD